MTVLAKANNNLTNLLTDRESTVGAMSKLCDSRQPVRTRARKQGDIVRISHQATTGEDIAN
jgi:hypothetical protein